MSRKQSNTVEYFPHFANQGKTLFILKSRYGNDGYACWFQLLEVLCRAEDHYYDCNKQEAWQYLVAQLSIKEITATEILDLLAKLGNIDAEMWKGKVIWCGNLITNLTEVYRKRGRVVPEKPILNITLQENLNINLQTVAEKVISDTDKPIPVTEMPQSKVKESKVKETKEKTDPLPPAPSLSVSADIEDVYKTAVENLQDVENFSQQDISTAINDYSKQWVTEAIREAVLSNNLTWGYVLGILHNCQNEKHSPSTGRAADPPSPSSCSGCNHHRSRNGQPERCAVGHHPPSKCEDYQPRRVDRSRGGQRR